jgi:LmbE family N-acetylglucosaminyl deacetylase
MTTPYHRFVSELERLQHAGREFPLGGFPTPERKAPAAHAPTVLIFSPHPDDECIIGGLALRFQREAGMRIVNVAVTQGSNKARQEGRWRELTDACNYLGFELVRTAPGGLEGINVKTRESDRTRWGHSVAIIADIITRHAPAAVFFPHATDWNSTHVGTHYLLADALAQLPADFSCHVLETEFWGAMADPNLMVELTAADVGDLMAALSFHVGEVQRNPYHLLVPAWMQDNVRRGAELVGGQGQGAPPFTFCTLYRHRLWVDGGFRRHYEGGRSLSEAAAGQSVLTL